MKVPDRKFWPIPATHAVKYIAQVVANRVGRDSHEPGGVKDFDRPEKVLRSAHPHLDSVNLW